MAPVQAAKLRCLLQYSSLFPCAVARWPVAHDHAVLVHGARHPVVSDVARCVAGAAQRGFVGELAVCRVEGERGYRFGLCWVLLGVDACVGTLCNILNPQHGSWVLGLGASQRTGSWVLGLGAAGGRNFGV